MKEKVIIENLIKAFEHKDEIEYKALTDKTLKEAKEYLVEVENENKKKRSISGFNTFLGIAFVIVLIIIWLPYMF